MPRKYPPNSIFLVGASTRAIAGSLRRRFSSVELKIYACDLFCDTDLSQSAISEKCVMSQYPVGLFDWLREKLKESEQPWMYAGGIENYPELVAAHESAADGLLRLVGCHAATLNQCRDPFQLADILQRHNHPLAQPQRQLKSHGTKPFLRKPIRSCAGMSITRSTSKPAGDEAHQNHPDFYWQPFIEGTQQSGQFVADGSTATLVGVTEGIVTSQTGDGRQSGLPPFQYAGCIGPLAASKTRLADWQALGQLLTEEFGLLGAFGIDAIINERDQIVPLEINPRFTASMELVDLAYGDSVAARHLHACLNPNRLPCPTPPARPTHTWAKLILYAPEQIIINAARIRLLHDASWLLNKLTTIVECHFSDIPQQGITIEKGAPLCSVLFASLSYAAAMENSGVNGQSPVLRILWEQLSTQYEELT